MLSQADLWEIAAASLHTDSFRKQYSRALAKIIGNTELSILDTACGTGFPTVDLYELGYQRIACADGDSSSVSRLVTFLKEKGIFIPVIQAFWQDLDHATDKTFDVVLNVDNSLVYLDGWLKNSTPDPEEAFERIVRVLKNFYIRLNPGGIVIIGSCDTLSETVTERTYLEKELEYKGKHIATFWHSRYDWLHRLRTWTAHVKIDGEQMAQSVQSYIVKKEEMEHLLKKAGFVDVKTIDIRGEEIYDFLFVGKKK